MLQFILVLLGLDHCNCSVAAADINGDGVVDFWDALLFMDLLRCNLDLDAPAYEPAGSIGDLLMLADELGVELDLRALLAVELKVGEVHVIPARQER